MRRPWRCRIAAVIRVVEDLPLVPSTWIVSKARSGEPSDGHHAPHPVQAEAHAEQLQRAQAALGARLGPAIASRDRLAGAP